MNMLELLVGLQDKLELPDDKMAWYLGVHPKQLAAFKSGREELPQHAGFILLDTTGYLKISEILIMALPKSVAQKLEIWQLNRAIQIADGNQDAHQN